MKEGPDIARIAALIGDPARANALTALVGGKALTVTELASEAGVTLQTASSHLAKLEEAGLVVARKSGRHKYFALAGPGVARLLEALMGLAAEGGHLRTRTGPKDAALRRARVCYDHLAGESGVQLYESLLARGYLGLSLEGPALSEAGRSFVASFGLPGDAVVAGRGPLCRECLDWSERKSHLAGRLGRAIYAHMLAEGWARRVEGSRAVQFTPKGKAAFDRAFPPTHRP